MSNWKNINEVEPIFNKLMLVKDDSADVFLRSLDANGDFWDENNNYDDSENEILQWCEIPA